MKTIITVFLVLISSILSLAPFAHADDVIENTTAANLVIYRPNDYSALNYRIWVDDRYMGKLKPKQSIELHVSPGKHVIRSNDRSRSQLEVTVSEHTVTYVRNEIYRKTRLAITEADGPQRAVAGI